MTRIPTQNEYADMQRCRCADVQMCRCADVQMCRCVIVEICRGRARPIYEAISCPLARRSIDNQRLLERGQVQGTRYSIQGTLVQDIKYKVQDIRYKVQGIMYRVQGTSPHEATPGEKLRSGTFLPEEICHRTTIGSR